MFEQLDLELLEPLKQLELGAPAGSPNLFLSRRAPVLGAGELGEAHVRHPLERRELHALNLLGPPDLELLEPPEQLEFMFCQLGEAQLLLHPLERLELRTLNRTGSSS